MVSLAFHKSPQTRSLALNISKHKAGEDVRFQRFMQTSGSDGGTKDPVIGQEVRGSTSFQGSDGGWSGCRLVVVI